ncbi:MAG: hypothetical protein V1907_01800 [Candidatus Kerfeldbacteria bacterium]
MGTESQEEGSPKGYGKTPEKPSDEAAQRQRLFSVVLAVGVAGLVIGGLYLYNSINAQFPKAKDVNTNAQIADAEAINELKNSDTDKDGLSDYDELFQYSTSPFLKDSDGDGVTDDKDADPNCPSEITGKTCGPVATSNANRNTNTSTSSQAAALREALKKSGAPANVVDNTDDQTLLRQYQTSVYGTNGNTNGNTNDSLENADLSDLNATQVRSLLEANGVDAATLDTIDNDTLMTIYYDAVSGSDSSSTN